MRYIVELSVRFANLARMGDCIKCLSCFAKLSFTLKNVETFY